MVFPGRLLGLFNLSPKKHMGQNFLVDPSTAEMIVRRADVGAKETVLEIGAGLGALTIPLARAANKLYAVEKDRDLLGVLADTLRKNQLDTVELIGSNIFDVDPYSLVPAEGAKMTVFGNLPYNISSQVVLWAIENREVIDRAVFMFQKEVARRIAAPAGSSDYGRLSVMVQYCSQVKRIAAIGARQFYPRPKVDSEVIEIFFDPATGPAAENEAFFGAVVKAAFGRRRKTLKNALSPSAIGVDGRAVECMWRHCNIDSSRRAETLAVSEFVCLADTLWRCIE